MDTRKQLLTIGQLSRFSGIHVKALRYYESIGILEPTYVNPENSYRYYSHVYIAYVTIIKICADYGLALKDFPRYLLPNHQIDMDKLIRDAMQKVEEREKALQDDKAYLHYLLDQLALSDQLDHGQKHHLETVNEDYLLLSFRGEILSDDYYQAVREGLETLKNLGLHFDRRIGIYYQYDETDLKTFLALKVKECHPDLELSFLCLENIHKHAEHIDKDSITDRLQSLHQEAKINEFLVLETMESPYSLSHPHLELRYFLPDRKMGD